MSDSLAQSQLQVAGAVDTRMTKAVPSLSREARLYAVSELSRRIGATPEFLRSWKIEIDHRFTTIFVSPGTQKRIRFKNLESQAERNDLFITRLADWPYLPPEQLQELVPQFVIPFATRQNSASSSLFTRIDPDCLDCDFDLPASTLLTLSRFEETLPVWRDSHGRFPAAQSIAFKGGFLNRPIIDEYALGLEQALKILMPGWEPRKRSLRVKLSHDIDDIGIPFSLRTAVGHTIRRRRPLCTVRDLSRLLGVLPTYLNNAIDIVRLSQERELDSAVYWKAADPGPFDTGYDPFDQRVRDVILWLTKQDIEVGVHPAYDTYMSPEKLRTEVERLRKAFGGRTSLGGRQHYLRWCPETWIHWEKCDLAYDSTVGFADHIGFRAGTCYPYHPWLLSLNRQARLLEIPLIVMDCTPLYYMGLPVEKGLQAIFECIERVRAVGGVFTLLWHNTKLVDPPYDRLYPTILDRLEFGDRFDWQTSNSELNLAS